MDRREELERKHRPELFKDCEICETNVRIEGHEHDTEKEKAYWAKVYPAVTPLETQISDILEKHIGIPLGDVQIDAITEELSNLFRGPVAGGQDWFCSQPGCDKLHSEHTHENS